MVLRGGPRGRVGRRRTSSVEAAPGWERPQLRCPGSGFRERIVREQGFPAEFPGGTSAPAGRGAMMAIRKSGEQSVAGEQGQGGGQSGGAGRGQNRASGAPRSQGRPSGGADRGRAGAASRGRASSTGTG